MHQKRFFPRSGVLTIFFDLWFVPGRRALKQQNNTKINDNIYWSKDDDSKGSPLYTNGNFISFFSLQLRTRNAIKGFVHPSVGPSVHPSVIIKFESVKTCISAPAHPSATGGRVSGLVLHVSSSGLSYIAFLSIQYSQVLRQYNTIPIQYLSKLYTIHQHCIQYNTISM